VKPYILADGNSTGRPERIFNENAQESEKLFIIGGVTISGGVKDY